LNLDELTGKELSAGIILLYNSMIGLSCRLF